VRMWSVENVIGQKWSVRSVEKVRMWSVENVIGWMWSTLETVPLKKWFSVEKVRMWSVENVIGQKWSVRSVEKVRMWSVENVIGQKCWKSETATRGSGGFWMTHLFLFYKLFNQLTYYYRNIIFILRFLAPNIFYSEHQLT